MSVNLVYLDHAATSPLRPEAREAWLEGSAIWANPSSPHGQGRTARASLEDARERIKAALGWRGEVIFTSGASEAARIAIESTVAPRKAALPVEHDAVLRGGPDTYDAIVPMLPEGVIRRSEMYEALGLAGHMRSELRNHALLAMQHVNPETGTLFRVDSHAAVLHGVGCLMLSDCAQSAGKIAIPLEADMVIVSAHKFGGPIGIGALLVRDFALLEPTGGQERGYRRGTENLPGAMGMAAALEAGEWRTSVAQREAFIERLGQSYRRLGDEQVDYILPLTHAELSARALVIRLDALGFAVSAGSACSSGSLKPSYVLKAFGMDDETASRTIRVSIGWNTTPEELDAFASAWEGLA